MEKPARGGQMVLLSFKGFCLVGVSLDARGFIFEAMARLFVMV